MNSEQKTIVAKAMPPTWMLTPAQVWSVRFQQAMEEPEVASSRPNRAARRRAQFGNPTRCQRLRRK